jgi:hypothetical protein
LDHTDQRLDARGGVCRNRPLVPGGGAPLWGSDSFAIKLQQRQRQSGSPAPARQSRSSGTESFRRTRRVLVGAQRVDLEVAHPLQFGLLHLHRDGLGLANASGSPKILLHQRIGMPYCRPPLVHWAFWPRLIFRREPSPTFFSKPSHA